MNTAAVLDSIDTLDMFSTPETIALAASKVRGGMVLVDPELGTPLYWIDSKARSTRNSGNAAFLVHNLETGRIENLSIFSSTTLPVMVKA